MTQIRNNRRPKSPRQAAATAGPLIALLDTTFFKALCDPTRASLIACLARCGRACSVGEIAECCAVDMSVVSRHLALLARAGIVEASKSGRTVSYRVRYAEVTRALRGVADELERCCPSAECCAGNCR